jgi:hypothetical protein
VKLLKPWVVVLPVLMLLGCSYALVGRGSNIPDDVQRVFLLPLENLTTRAQVEQILNQSIADEIVLRGRFDITSAAEGSDAVLTGDITGFRVVPVAFDDEGLAAEYEVSISARMTFNRVGGDEEVLWHSDNYVFREKYLLEDEETSFFDRENVAIVEVSIIFAKNLLTDLMEGF